ncbi:MAG: hypothetical protein Q7S93_10100 [Phenylobacterium sp.]|uniref:hypothetical protein n=1 Tax=Phenylobacterium sp. TaxID=1871053 RepID=UPI002723821E|nr:hypothetical protein [Phenylobacterium sp.]MDO8410398.1 hypothetical protein [Phenylobacterium sp.]
MTGDRQRNIPSLAGTISARSLVGVALSIAASAKTHTLLITSAPALTLDAASYSREDGGPVKLMRHRGRSAFWKIPRAGSDVGARSASELLALKVGLLSLKISHLPSDPRTAGFTYRYLE